MGKQQTTLPPHPPEGIPPLRDGERLDQKTFHERYEAMPPTTRAELIGGVVHMPSPLKNPHGATDIDVITWLGWYKGNTPGTHALANTTIILSDGSEHQPDGMLVIEGGQTHVNEDEYSVGAPELITQVSWSTEASDLGQRRHDYEQVGVREYVVVLVRRREVRWFVRREAGFEQMQPDADGFFKSKVFPGLWLDPEALLNRDTIRIHEVLNQGLASPEHARFVESLRRP